MSSVSPLPKAMQAVRADHLAAANGAGTVVPAPSPTPPADPAPKEPAAPVESAAPESGASAPSPAPEERITLTRAEFNELQASKASAARLEAANLRIEELQQRLTELEAAARDKPQVETPPRAPLVDVGDTTITEDEQRDFGESQPFVEKVARRVFSQMLPAIEDRLSKLEQGVQAAGATANKVVQSTFQSAVYSRVPDIRELVSHKHWVDFLDTREEYSGKTFETLLGDAIREGDVDRTVKLYDAFRKRYVGEKQPSVAAAYSGAVPSGAATVEPQEPKPVEKMKLSDRKRISEDYRKGRISWEEKEKFDKKFLEAEKAGNVDYNA